MKYQKRWPETAMVNENCCAENWILANAAQAVFDRIEAVLDSFKNEKSLYFNNVIGIIGGRGHGKSSLAASVGRTLKNESLDAKHQSLVGKIIPLCDPIDPKTLPDDIGIVGLVVGELYANFVDKTKDGDCSSKQQEIFELFDELNLRVANLSQIEKRTPSQNPSDLYDLSRLITVREDLAALIKALHEYDGPADDNKAYLITIDDFDLDAANCHEMAMNIVTYLTIPGLIFLLAMDENLFLDEIRRSRIAEISDFGSASNSIFEYESNPREGPYIEKIITKTNRYANQLSEKLIPLSNKIFLTNDLLNDQEAVKICDDLYDWLIKIDVSENEPSLKTRFRNELLSSKDLRQASQAMNKISDVLSKRLASNPSSIDGPISPNEKESLIDLFDKTFEEPFILNARNRVSRPNSNDYLSHSLLLEISAHLRRPINEDPIERTILNPLAHSKNIIGNDDGKPIYVSDLASPFFSKHPLAFHFYELFAERLDPSSPLFLRQLADLLQQMCAPNKVIYEPRAKKDAQDYLLIGEKRIAGQQIRARFKNVRLNPLLSDINEFLLYRGRLTRPQLAEVVAEIEDFNDAGPNMMLETALARLRAILNESWRTAEERERRKLDADRLLRYIRTRLNGQV